MSRFILKFILTILLLTLTSTLIASNKVAKVIILRGKVEATSLAGKKVWLKKRDWVDEGVIINSHPKSYVKLLFKDKTQMSLGPRGRLKITSFPSDRQKAGVVSLLNGKLRSIVQKNFLKKRSESNTKLFIKTRSAALGVRGTDFLVTYNMVNQITNTITYEGEVIFAPLTEQNSSLDRAINMPTATVVRTGQFSTRNHKLGSRPTIATKLNPTQFHALKSNKNFLERSAKMVSKGERRTKKRPVTPPGLSSKDVQVKTKDVMKSMGRVFAEKAELAVGKVVQIDTPPPEGSVNTKTGEITPPAGGFLDLKSGIYVPPSPGSEFDSNTGVYQPLPLSGSVDPDTGDYIPPKGLDINEETGEFEYVDPIEEKPKEDVDKKPESDPDKKPEGKPKDENRPIKPPLLDPDKPLPPGDPEPLVPPDEKEPPPPEEPRWPERPPGDTPFEPEPIPAKTRVNFKIHIGS
ncbi:MAG: FecR domain-containing protein [Bdellovibrionales bacterium]|jgi:hypothetical protein|nr:FecR domain-containing protein [Bdellovibrionales bacterium]MBT3527023.1 FecR domain-containing protein [Bdellovibrionales bacterium]MBT7668019.1 FecR domain-containing protein [Bdellovibrionales bacterium]